MRRGRSPRKGNSFVKVTAPHSPDAGGSGYSLITRRTFIGILGSGLLATPLAAGAQQAGKVSADHPAEWRR